MINLSNINNKVINIQIGKPLKLIQLHIWWKECYGSLRKNTYPNSNDDE